MIGWYLLLAYCLIGMASAISMSGQIAIKQRDGEEVTEAQRIVFPLLSFLLWPVQAFWVFKKVSKDT